jgi:hypothetical protein
MSKTAAVRATDRVSQTVAALARLLDQVMNDIQALDSEVQEQVLAASAEWEGERARLVADCEHANDLLQEARKEQNRALAETDEAAAIALELQVSTAVNRMRSELTAQMDADRATLIAERNRAQQRLADAASECELQVREAVNKVRLELTKEIESLRDRVEEANQAAAMAQASAATEVASDRSQVIQAEIARVEAWIHEISQLVESPHTELSVVIRKNVERAELQSYLRGLRFQVSGK